MKIKNCVILIALVSICGSEIYASCLSCWKLQYIEVEYYNGEIKSGFLGWNEIWVNNSEQLHKIKYDHLNDFCDTLVAFYDNRYKHLTLNKEIIFKKNITGKSPIAVGQADTIDVLQIQHLRLVDRDLNGFESAGRIASVNKQQASLLQNEPFAFYKTAGWGLSDAYYLSYDAKIDKAGLIEIAKNRNEKSVFDKKVILLEIHYD